jgi:hypothetical protein
MKSHASFFGWFLLAAFGCLFLASFMAGDSVCTFDPASTGCAAAEAGRAHNVRVYFTFAAILALAAVIFHTRKSRFTGVMLWLLLFGPLLVLLVAP